MYENKHFICNFNLAWCIFYEVKRYLPLKTRKENNYFPYVLKVVKYEQITGFKLNRNWHTDINRSRTTELLSVPYVSTLNFLSFRVYCAERRKQRTRLVCLQQWNHGSMRFYLHRNGTGWQTGLVLCSRRPWSVVLITAPHWHRCCKLTSRTHLRPTLFVALNLRPRLVKLHLGTAVVSIVHRNTAPLIDLYTTNVESLITFKNKYFRSCLMIVTCYSQYYVELILGKEDLMILFCYKSICAFWTWFYNQLSIRTVKSRQCFDSGTPALTTSFLDDDLQYAYCSTTKQCSFSFNKQFKSFRQNSVERSYFSTLTLSNKWRS